MTCVSHLIPLAHQHQDLLSVAGRLLLPWVLWWPRCWLVAGLAPLQVLVQPLCSKVLEQL